MENDSNNHCACKGIRSCLTCEKEKGIRNYEVSLNEEHLVEYTFCHSCGLCWPSIKCSNDYDECRNLGFHLPGVLVIHDFISEKEEKQVVSNIDQMSWVPSQSGRRKQDFGPKVNFKKRKVKIGEFNGFPEFSSFIIERLTSVPSVSSFLPVELCNLEYCPERGSAIEPHVDDFWLWGERLITLNLLSSTFLTLTPMGTDQCNPQCKNENVVRADLLYNNSNVMDSEYISKEIFMDSNQECGHPVPLKQKHDENHIGSSVTGSCFNTLKADLRNGICVTVFDDHHISDEDHQKIPQSDSSKIVPCIKNKCLEWNSKPKLKKIVKLSLPPRSLLVLYGCARYHWFHAIERSDIKDRRLAMTLRELSSEFLPGGPQFELGKELLDIAKLQCKS